MKKKYRVPVYWTMSTDIEVEAESEDEAAQEAYDYDLDVTRDGTYSDGSFEVMYDSIQEIDPIVFVFGSNIAGRHGLGAARRAHEEYEAQMGVGVGRTGMSYAIPTKDAKLDVLPLSEIKKYVDDFIVYAENNPYQKFYVTKVGCGLAGYTEEAMAPLFEGCPANCELRYFKEEELI